jgi:nitroimidazol reductase NimA-like FMN-containing flavoprotein (pyridoxamine 5'-phosphate oxidase superfamily)
MKPDDMGKSEAAFDKQVKAGFKEVLKREAAEQTQDELKRRILRFLKRNVIGSLATCSDNIPRSTPVRFRYDDGFHIYVLTEGGGKLRNVRKNPHVSFSVYGTYTGFKSCRGLQIWGRADIIAPDEGEKYETAYQAMALEEREDLKKIQTSEMPARMPIIKIFPERIRYLSVPEGILNQEIESFE